MKYFIFLSIILLFSCSSTTFFKEIDTRVEEINNQHNNIIKWKEVVKTSEKIFRKLNNQLRNSDHYIYIYTLEYKSMFIDDRSFNKGMVYNVKSEKKYYIYKEKKKVIINPKSISFVFEEFLLDNYLDKKNDYLKSLQNNVKWSHPNGICHYILEVKKNEKMKYLVLEPIYLNENGIPL